MLFPNIKLWSAYKRGFYSKQTFNDCYTIVKGQTHEHDEETREKHNKNPQRISIELFSGDPIE